MTPSVAANVTVVGYVQANLTVYFVTAPPAGSLVYCGLSLVSNDTLTPTDSKSTTAVVSGSSATCVVRVNYRWTVASVATKMTIAYSVSGPSQTSTGIAQVITLPPNNAQTALAVVVRQ